MKKALLLLLAPLMAFALELGFVPLHITLQGDNGGLIDGSAWDSSILKDKVYVLFYVDPDKKEINDAVTQALKAKKFDRNNYASMAIINMAATWLPNFAISSALEKKQKEFPDTIYAKDLNKVLVKEWKLADDSSDVLLFDKSGKLIYIYEGKLNNEEISKLINLIEANI